MARQGSSGWSQEVVAASRARRLTRRHVVGGALGVAGAGAIGAGLGRLGGLAIPGLLAAAQAEAIWVPEIWERPAKDGLLNLELVAMGNASPEGTLLGYGLSIDPANPDHTARSPGPTLRLGRGDRLRIRLVNHLDGIPELAGSVTNLHVHGLHVSPGRNSDNIFLHVEAGHDHGGFDFEFQIPENHRSGLFWYHPHLHGTTAKQVQKGLAGAIIIEERESDAVAVRDEPPVVKGVPERLLVLQHLLAEGPPEVDQLQVNGAHLPNIPFRPGERERWRILNASSDTFFNLYLDGHPFYRVAVDGNWLEEADPITVVPLGPAERAEVLIDWGFASSYPLSVLVSAIAPGMLPVFEKTDGVVSRPLATLGPAVTAALAPGTPGPSLEPPSALLPLDDLRAIPAVPTRHLDFQNALSINGKRFKEGRIDQTVELGGIEEWNVRNTSEEDRGWHPFHIHVNDFQVLSISEEQLEPVWFTDTVPLPTGGHVVMRMLFPDFTGRFVYHCHFLSHEDSGMMGVIDVAALVRISGSTLVPDRAVVSVGPTVPPLPNNGTTVVWTNLDHDACIIVAEDTDLLTNQPLFSSAILEHGASFAHTFDAPGTFTYRCATTDGPGLTGAVTVAAEQTVEILESSFHPAEVVVAVGTTVAWTNRNPSAHTATADALDASDAPLFDTGRLSPLAVGRHTFAEPGDFSYHSELNPGEMKGTVKVRPVMRQSVSVGIFDDAREQPETIEVVTGSTVTWANRGRVTWRVNVDGINSGLLDPERLFVQGQPLYPGQRFLHTFLVAGEFPFTTTAPDAAFSHDGTVKVVQPVEVVNYGALAFEPSAADIRSDAEVVWINRDTVAHTVTVLSADDEPIFDSGPFGPGEQRRFPFPAAGTFTYRVTAQPTLVGTITVQDLVR